MRRRLGRTLGLDIRIAWTLFAVALIYVGAIVVFAAITVAAAWQGDWVTAASSIVFVLLLMFAARNFVRETSERALRTVGAKPLRAGEHPELDDMVDRLAAAADLPSPRLAFIHSRSANAFGVGLNPGESTVAVTTELLRRLEPPEIEAVLGHEIAHIANYDGAVMTFASGPSMAGSALWHDDDQRGKFAFLLFYWPVYIAGLFLMRTMSRYREYAADRGSALLTGAPEQLMSALVKIAGREPRGDLRGGAAISAFCIVSTRSRRFELLSDHPPLEKRLERLATIAREMGKRV